MADRGLMLTLNERKEPTGTILMANCQQCNSLDKNMVRIPIFIVFKSTVVEAPIFHLGEMLKSPCRFRFEKKLVS